MNISDKIRDLKKKVDSHNSRVERLQGQREAALEQLKNLGFDSVEAAEKWLGQARAELAQKEEELKQDIQEFELEYSEYLQ